MKNQIETQSTLELLFVRNEKKNMMSWDVKR